MPGVVRYGTTGDMASFIDAADPVYGTGQDGSFTLDGTTTVLGMAPSANVYSMTTDLYFQNLTINAGVTLAPNGYRIFVKGTLTLNNNSVIGFTTGYSTAGSIAQRRCCHNGCHTQFGWLSNRLYSNCTNSSSWWI